MFCCCCPAAEAAAAEAAAAEAENWQKRAVLRPPRPRLSVEEEEGIGATTATGLGDERRTIFLIYKYTFLRLFAFSRLMVFCCSWDAFLI